MEKPERITLFIPAFDKRHPKNYGIGSVKVFMVLKHPKAEYAVHFIFLSGMFLPETIQEYATQGKANPVKYQFSDKWHSLQDPMGADVGYHDAEAPHYEGQEQRSNCDWLNGKGCYGDGSALLADKWMDILLREGSDKIWQMLEEQYKEVPNERLEP